jgi:hypothetical protein
METMKLQVQALINHAARQAERLRREDKTAKAIQFEDFGVALMNVLDNVSKKDD